MTDEQYNDTDDAFQSSDELKTEILILWAVAPLAKLTDKLEAFRAAVRRETQRETGDQ